MDERGGAAPSHAALMDGVYRYQRHVYDLTRKYYLLGRDRLIDSLDVPPGGTVLELGCGTGRNLVQGGAALIRRRSFCGLDISAEMLETASVAIGRRDLTARVRLAHGDASDFDARRCSGVRLRSRIHFLRVVDDPGVAAHSGVGARRRR